MSGNEEGSPENGLEVVDTESANISVQDLDEAEVTASRTEGEVACAAELGVDAEKEADDAEVSNSDVDFREGDSVTVDVDSNSVSMSIVAPTLPGSSSRNNWMPSSSQLACSRRRSAGKSSASAWATCLVTTFPKPP